MLIMAPVLFGLFPAQALMPAAKATAGVTTDTRPTRFHEPIVTVAGDKSLLVTWTPPGSPVSIDGYVVEMSAADRRFGGVGSADCMRADADRCEVAGLTAGTAYTFRVRVHGSHGADQTSPPSAPTVALATPGVPRLTGVSPGGDRSAVLTWQAPDPADAPVESYLIELSTGGGPFALVESGDCTVATASPCTVTGLRDDARYTFRVIARNEAGAGPPSTPGGANAGDPAGIAPGVAGKVWSDLAVARGFPLWAISMWLVLTAGVAVLAALRYRRAVGAQSIIRRRG